MSTYSVRYVERPSKNLNNVVFGDGENHEALSSPPLLPIILGSYRSPSVAVFNALLLMGKIELPSFGVDSIKSSMIMDILSAYAFEYEMKNSSSDGDMMAAMEIASDFMNEKDAFIIEDDGSMDVARKSIEANKLEQSNTNSYGLHDPMIARSKIFESLGLELWNLTLVDPNKMNTNSYLLNLHQHQPLTPYGYTVAKTAMEAATTVANVKSNQQQYCPVRIVAFGGRFYVLTMMTQDNDCDDGEGDMYVLLTDQVLLDSNDHHCSNVVWKKLDRIYDNSHRHQMHPSGPMSTSSFADSNFQLINGNAISPVVRNGLTDFTKLDLDWINGTCMMEQKVQTKEIIREYRCMLGYSDYHVKECDDYSNSNDYNNELNDENYARRVHQQIMMEESMNRNVANTNHGNSDDGNESSDEAFARRMQQQIIMEERINRNSFMNGLSNNTAERSIEDDETDDDLAAAIALSMKDTDDGNHENDENVESENITSNVKVLDLICGLEVRSKYFMDQYMRGKTDDNNEDWEIWSNQGSNVLRSYSSNEEDTEQHIAIQNSRDLSRHYGDRLGDKVMVACKEMMVGKEKILPDAMRSAAEVIATGELLLRRNEHDRLVALLLQQPEQPRQLNNQTFSRIDEARTTKLQARFRGFIVRHKIHQYNAATKLQARFRGFIVRHKIHQYNAATKLQARFRGFIVRHKIHQYNAATKIQATFRGMLNRWEFEKKRTSTTKINAIARRFIDRRRYGDTIRAGYEEWLRVHDIWKPVIIDLFAAKECAPKSYYFSWQNLKTSLDISQAEQNDQETNAHIDAVQESLLSHEESKEDDSDEDLLNDETTSSNPIPSKASCIPYQDCNELLSDNYSNIMLSQASLKWFKNADSKYQGFFLRRMKQFANGEYERSLKLRKRLTGSKHIIYEAYLEQKVAYRILFTECKTKDEHNENIIRNSILVWYISSHDRVSRYIRQIDEAEARMSRQFRSSAASLFDTNGNEAGNAMMLENDTILLDPLANTPLKIHQLPFSDIEKLKIEAWTPPFRLTKDEKRIVSTPGTVLVLGRSGTGKTVCIVNRMIYDANFNGIGTKLKQLFISRSRRIKSLVGRLVEDVMSGESRSDRSFLSYERFLHIINNSLFKIGFPTRLSTVDKSHRGFLDFKQDFFLPMKKEMKIKLSPLTVWTQIRSFIKGSIEAVMHGRPLTMDEYLGLGAKYCRLKKDQRREAYLCYEKYSSWLETIDSYDACDKTTDLLNRIKKVSFEDRYENGIYFDKIYVDECQDFTSSDFALFWYLGGDLFLAGDTAQSVEQGVSFRFEEVKRVFYEMGNGTPSGMPSSPLTIHINFRSHSGILEVAAEVLKMLHNAFPGAANKIRRDAGLFKGPRPCILYIKRNKFLGFDALLDIMAKNPSLVLLTPDNNVEFVKEHLGSTAQDFVILGICEAKGLDFDEVMILDFFSSSTKRLGVGWKELFRGNITDIDENFPELEMSLKLLYTGITRCRHRLFFAETQQSQVGDAFSRWIMGTGLIEKQDVLDLSETIKTVDEWRSLGVEYAINAELQDHTDQEADAWFKRSSMCFKQANDDFLLQKIERQAQVCKEAFRVKDSNWDELKHKAPKFVHGCLDDGGLIDEAIDMCEIVLDRCPMNEQKFKDAVEKVLERMRKDLKHL